MGIENKDDAVKRMIDHWQALSNDEQEKRNAYWQALRKAREDFIKNFQHGYYEPSDGEFKRWMEEMYGIGIIYREGNIAGDYAILDDAKHLMFILKYSGK